MSHLSTSPHGELTAPPRPRYKLFPNFWIYPTCPDFHHASDEIIQLILNELDDPTNFSLVSKRYYIFTQDPYVRSSYFLSRYGRIQALYWALGRGRLMNAKVVDVSVLTVLLLLFAVICGRLMTLLTSDTPVVWRSHITVLRPVRHAPLLPYRSSAVHQDSMGPLNGPGSLHALPDNCCSSIWKHTPWKRGRRRLDLGSCYQGESVPCGTEDLEVGNAKGGS